MGDGQDEKEDTLRPLVVRRAGSVVRPVVFVSPLLTTLQKTIDLRCCVLVVLFLCVLSGPPFFVLFVCFQLSVASMLLFGFSPFRLDDRVMMLIVLQFPCVCTCASCCP